jgi:epoxide hydrolase-like predicted phosphatase
VATEPRALLVDWGGVMTTDVFAAFAGFCATEGLHPETVGRLFREDRDARRLLADFECGRIGDEVFEPRLGAALGVPVHEGLIDRIMGGAVPDERMIAAVRSARAAGVRIGLVSNSWGSRRYPHELLAEIFDGIVISGDEGFRKPDARMYALGAERIGMPPERCVYVDDLAFNLGPASELGMAVVHHTSVETTLPELERLLGVVLGVVLGDDA